MQSSQHAACQLDFVGWMKPATFAHSQSCFHGNICFRMQSQNKKAWILAGGFKSSVHVQPTPSLTCTHMLRCSLDFVGYLAGSAFPSPFLRSFGIPSSGL
eukprot:2300527-Rhodomonas_salina.7